MRAAVTAAERLAALLAKARQRCDLTDDEAAALVAQEQAEVRAERDTETERE